MKLLGDRNWYLPRWLGWLPDVRIEGAPVANERDLAALPASGDD
jgi:RND superfamily putative drug exporter